MTPQYFQVGEEVLIFDEDENIFGFETRIVHAIHGDAFLSTGEVHSGWAYMVDPDPSHRCDFPCWPQESLRKKPKPATGSYDEVIGWVKMGCPKKVLEEL